MKLQSNRAGRITTTLTGYECFVPEKLPPKPEIKIDMEMMTLLSEADNKLGRLDGNAADLQEHQCGLSVRDGERERDHEG